MEQSPAAMMIWIRGTMVNTNDELYGQVYRKLLTSSVEAPNSSLRFRPNPVVRGSWSKARKLDRRPRDGLVADTSRLDLPVSLMIRT